MKRISPRDIFNQLLWKAYMRLNPDGAVGELVKDKYLPGALIKELSEDERAAIAKLTPEMINDRIPVLLGLEDLKDAKKKI